MKSNESVTGNPVVPGDKQAELAIRKRLEYLRRELRAERISYGELGELQSLVKFIDNDDVELLEAAGVPEGVRTSEPCPHCGREEDGQWVSPCPSDDCPSHDGKPTEAAR